MNVGDRNAFVPLSKKTPPSLAVNTSLRMLLHGLKKLDMECVESSIAYDREALLLLSLSAASSNEFSRSSGVQYIHTVVSPHQYKASNPTAMAAVVGPN